MKRAFAVITLISFLAPVLNASQGTAVSRSPDYWYAYATKLPIGSTVRVRTTDGKRLTAALAIVDREGVTLEPRTRVPEPARLVRYDDITQLELQKSHNSLAKGVAIGAAIGAGVLVGFLIFIANAMD